MIQIPQNILCKLKILVGRNLINFLTNFLQWSVPIKIWIFTGSKFSLLKVIS